MLMWTIAVAALRPPVLLLEREAGPVVPLDTYNALGVRQ